MTEESKNRVYLFDNVKFFLIILVVIGHFMDAFASDSGAFRSCILFIYSFHMPLFIFISGLFHRNKNIPQKVVPLVITGLLLNIVGRVTQGILDAETPTMSYLVHSGLPWYVISLAAFILISYFIRNLDKRLILVFSIVLACFAGYDSGIGDYLCLSRIVVFYPFYLFGEILTSKPLLTLNSKKWIKAVSAGIIAVWVFLCFKFRDFLFLNIKPMFTGRNNYFSLPNANIGFALRLIAYAIALMIGFAVIMVIPNKKVFVITKSGARTMQVYFWHYTVLRVLLFFEIGSKFIQTPSGKICWIAIAVLLTFVLSLKPFGFPTNLVFSIAKQKKCK